jgi:hypothetical protein
MRRPGPGDRGRSIPAPFYWFEALTADQRNDILVFLGSL